MLNLDALPAAWNPGQLSASQIRDTINHVGGVRAMDWSFRLLQRDLTPIEVPGAPAWDPAELPAQYVYAGTCQMNTQSDTPMTLSLDLIEGPGLSYDPMHTLLQLHCDYYAGGTYEAAEYRGATYYRATKGQRILHLPVGIFMALMPDRDHAGQYPVWHLNLYDETWRLANLKFSSEWALLAGDNWISMAIQLMTLPISGGTTRTDPFDSTLGGCPISGPGFDPARISIPPSPSLCPIDDSWKQSDTFTKAVKDCLQGSDTPYWPLWQDRAGTFVSAPQPFYSDALPAPGWVFDTTPGNPAIITPPIKQQYDLSSAKNEITVYGGNANGPAVAATAQNLNLNSAISIPNLGYPMNDTIQIGTITTTDQAYFLAQLALQGHAVVGESVNFQCLPVPVMDPHDALGFTVRGPGSTRYIGNGPTLDVEYTPGAILIDSSIPYELLSYQIDMQKRAMSCVAGRMVGV